MKKTLFTLMVLLSFSCIISAQEDAEKQKSSSKTVEFSKKSGAFMKKEFQEMGSTDGVKFTNIYFQDVLSNEKASALRLQTSYYLSSGSTEYDGTLDPDELDACIKCLNYIKDNCVGTSPELYTEMIYKTRDGVSIGAFYSKDNKKKEWTIFIQTASYTYRSMKPIKEENLSKVIELFSSAKSALAK